MKNTQNEAFPAPKGLSSASVALWHEVVPRQARSPERLTMVEQALRSLDRAESCRDAIERDGLMIGGEGKIAHINPLLKAEKDARGQFAALWKSLHLIYNGTIDGRRAL